jgi:hypothetical protein
MRPSSARPSPPTARPLAPGVALYRAKRSGGSKIAVFDEASMGAGGDAELTERGEPRGD